MEDVLYREQILAHYRRPRHYGLREDFDVEAIQENPTCGDTVTVRLKFSGAFVADVCFENEGCVLSGAAGSMTSDHVIGKTKDYVAAMAVEDVLRLLNVPITPGRVKCATLFLDAVKKVL